MKIQRTCSSVHKAITKPSCEGEQRHPRKQSKSVPPKSPPPTPDASKMSSAELLNVILTFTTQSDELQFHPLYKRLRQIQDQELEEDQSDATKTYADFINSRLGISSNISNDLL
jgi:hypothetical protein